MRALVSHCTKKTIFRSPSLSKRCLFGMIVLLVLVQCMMFLVFIKTIPIESNKSCNLGEALDIMVRAVACSGGSKKKM